MNRNRIIIGCCLIIAFISILSCSDFQFEEEPQLVVEGWIEADKYPVVILTTSIPINTERQEIDDLKNYLIRWARVAISDGEKEIILIGKYDNRYFPPYIYTTPFMKGEVNKTYRLTVDYQDFHATASTTIPEPVNIDSFQIREIAGKEITNTKYGISAFFQSTGKGNCFKIFTKTAGLDTNYRSSFMGTVDDSQYTDSTIEIPVYKSSQLTSNDDHPYFALSDTVNIRFAHIDRPAYQFWYEYDKIISLSKNVFTAYSKNPPSNVEGAIGYWCGYGSSYYQLIIKELAGNSHL